MSLKYVLHGIISITITIFALNGTGSAQAQEKVLYSFCSAANCADGASPQGILVFDKTGNLYGAAAGGGSNCHQIGKGGCGVVFELSPSQGGTWTESVLYNFCANDIQGCPDGANPYAGLSFDKSGNLYGTTMIGGAYGLGTVFELMPPTTQGGTWTETVLWSFGATGDGQNPIARVILDSSGNLYGTTEAGGTYSGGTIFQLVPSSSGNQWTENLLFSFGPDPNNGFDVKSGLIFDKAGNLYGTTFEGGAKQGFGLGVVYKLSPNQQLPWTETVLVRFDQHTGGNPWAGVNFDGLGNLYGTTTAYAGDYGSVYRVSVAGKTNVLAFSGVPGGALPYAGLLIAGNVLYGTTASGGTQNGGSVYKLVGRKETVVYSFCSQPKCADGYQPLSNLTSRSNSLFGVTSRGGANNTGVVYQISIGGTLARKNSARSAGSHTKMLPVAAPPR